MEDGELCLGFETDREAEELMRLMEDGEFSLEVDCETLLEDDAWCCEHCWSTLSTGISSKRQSIRLMEGDELFSEAEESMRLIEEGEGMNWFEAEQAVGVEFDCMGDTDPSYNTGSRLLIFSKSEVTHWDSVDISLSTTLSSSNGMNCSSRANAPSNASLKLQINAWTSCHYTDVNNLPPTAISSWISWTKSRHDLPTCILKSLLIFIPLHNNYNTVASSW